MESEFALHSAIVALSPVTVAPALFGTLLALHAVESLLQLLSHENADVACAVLDLLHELTDPSLLADEEQEEDAEAELIDKAVNSLVDALVRCSMLAASPLFPERDECSLRICTQALVQYLRLHALQMEQRVVEVLIQNAQRLNEASREESDGIHATLGLFSVCPRPRPRPRLRLCLCPYRE